MTAVATAIERIASSSGDYLNLKGLGLTTADVKVLMPRIIEKLPHLKHLDLSDNTFDTLPPEIGHLSELLTLYVSGNQLTELPSTIGNLLQLTDLNVSNNHLIQLPSETGRLRNLKKLNVSHNRLEALPDTIGNFLRLVELDVSENNLMQLPSTIGNLLELFTFDISGNNLTELPDTIENLLRLKILKVCNNRLVQLPPGISKLTNLSRLILNDNRLTQFPESIAGGLPALLQLSLMNNPLSEETMRWLRGTIGRTAEFDRAAHDEIKDYKAVLNKLYRGEEGTAQAMITLIETANEGDAEKQGLAKILKDFLRKMPHGQGPVQEVYDKTVKYLLQKIKDRDENTAALIKTSLGNCATPVKSFLLQTAIGLAGENKIDVGSEILDQLIAREALQEKVIQVLEGKLSRNEAIEAVQGLLNALFLAGAEENSENKIKISGERLRLPSTSAYPDFAFTQVRGAWIEPFAKLCCKTNADGTLQKDNKGNYTFDPDKLSKLVEDYRENHKIFSAVGEEVLKFKTDFEKELSNCKSILSNPKCPEATIYMDYDDKNNPIPILRNILLGFKPDMYEKIRQQFLKTVKGKLRALNQEWKFVENSEAALEEVSEEYEKMFTSDAKENDSTLKKFFDIDTKKEILKSLIAGKNPDEYHEILQEYLKSLKILSRMLKKLPPREESHIPLSSSIDVTGLTKPPTSSKKSKRKKGKLFSSRKASGRRKRMFFWK